MSLFEHKDYRSYLREYIQKLPKRGRGELSKIAHHLRVNTTLLSQIMSGGRELSPEQAFELSRYLGHSEIEIEYFSLLVQKERASTKSLRDHLDRKLESTRKDAAKLSKRLAHEKKLSDSERAIFYSSWIYSAAHLFASTKERGISLDDIAQRFGISRAKAAETMQFLVKCGLCIERSDHYIMGTQSTFVELGSPCLLKHHSNWRLKALQKSESLSEDELMYTGQVSLSRGDFDKIREELAEFLKRTMQTVKNSPAEEIASLNIDWIWIE